MITPWGVQCGIASYARSLVESVRGTGLEFLILSEYNTPPEQTDLFTTVGCWLRYSDDVMDLKKELRRSTFDVVHIQLQWFHAGHVMKEMIEAAIDTGRPVIIQFHNTLAGGNTIALEEIAGSLTHAARLIVHGEADAARVAIVASGCPISIVPLGQPEYPETQAPDMRFALGLENRSPVVGTFGYLFPHKGVKETIQAIALLKKRHPDILYIAACSIYPHYMSLVYLQECRMMIIELGLKDDVVLITDFLPEQTALTLLSACDVLALPYLPTTESASAAVRFALSAHRPVVVTRQEIFDAVAPAVHLIDDASPEAIAQGIDLILSDRILSESLVQRGIDLARTASWAAIGAQYREMIRSLDTT